MIDMHSKYDNMHKNEMFYALIYINNHIIMYKLDIINDSWYLIMLGELGALMGKWTLGEIGVLNWKWTLGESRSLMGKWTLGE